MAQTDFPQLCSTRCRLVRQDANATLFVSIITVLHIAHRRAHLHEQALQAVGAGRAGALGQRAEQRLRQRHAQRGAVGRQQVIQRVALRQRCRRRLARACGRGAIWRLVWWT